jgi:hypothetical protein
MEKQHMKVVGKQLHGTVIILFFMLKYQVCIWFGLWQSLYCISFFVLLSGPDLITVTWQLLHGSSYALLFPVTRSGSGFNHVAITVSFFVLLSGLDLVTVTWQLLHGSNYALLLSPAARSGSGFNHVASMLW